MFLDVIRLAFIAKLSPQMLYLAHYLLT